MYHKTNVFIWFSGFPDGNFLKVLRGALWRPIFFS